MDIVDVIVKKRHQIIKTCTKYGAKNVRVFGSCARDDYDEKSDVDVLINLKTDKTGFAYVGQLCSLQGELEKILGKRVDLIDERALKGTVKRRILKEAVAL
jgi:uncharacterized protein